MDSKDTDAGNFIPASQRPDGSWRKPRRVKEGYVPQEEVPLYESKGKQFLNRKAPLPEGMPKGIIAHHSIPGLFIQEEKVKKQKKKPKTQAVDEVIKVLSKTKIDTVPTNIQLEPAKRLKNLKKRLREIETLEEKIKSGEIKNPEKDQLDKVTRKKEIVKEITILETSANR